MSLIVNFLMEVIHVLNYSTYTFAVAISFFLDTASDCLLIVLMINT